MNKQQGFTLIELVIVIVILGILAAVALPRFINVTQDARIASVNGMAGGVRSAMSLAKAQFMVDGTNTSPVNMDGTDVTVDTTFGFPTGVAGGIDTAMQSTDGFNVTFAGAGGAGDPFSTRFRPVNGGSATCQVEYFASDLLSAPTVAANVVVTPTC